MCIRDSADTDLVQKVDAHLLEDAGPDAAEHVRAALALDDHRVDSGLRQELAEQQAGRARADDRDLRPRGHAASIPWRRFASVAAGDARNSSSARAASGRRARAPTAAEKVVTIW